MNGMLQLSAEEVRAGLPMADAIEAMRDAFAQLARGEVNLPPRLHMDAEAEHGVALIMPCHSRSRKLFSLKMVTLFSDNRNVGLQLIQSTVILTDGATGTPLAVMDGASLTAIRTGAASGLATDLLARKDARTVAIFGAGVQARTQLEAVCCVRPIERVRVYGRDADKAELFASEMTGQLGVPVQRADSPAVALQDAAIICTATPATAPVFADADLMPGAHVNAVGSFRTEMIEIPAATVARSFVVVDHGESAREEAGDLIAPWKAGLISESCFGTELGDLVLGRLPGRQADGQITLFKSVGVAIQDLCAAARLLENLRSA